VEGIERIPDVHQLRLFPLQAETLPEKKWKGQKKMFAMKIYSDTNNGVGFSLSTILRHESTRNCRLYSYSNIERFFGAAVSGRELPI
jgi:hypothetical protein